MNPSSHLKHTFSIHFFGGLKKKLPASPSRCFGVLDRGPGTEIHLTEVEDLHQDLKAAPWLGMQTTNKPGGGRFQTKHV